MTKKVEKLVEVVALSSHPDGKGGRHLRGATYTCHPDTAAQRVRMGQVEIKTAAPVVAEKPAAKPAAKADG